jgi:hypothetical protein
MSAGNRHPRLRFAMGITMALVWVGSGVRASRADDLIDEVNRRTQVAAQKTELELRAALLEAQKLSAKEPERAEELLKVSLARIEEDTNLSDARRESLKRVFQDRLRVLRLNNDKAAVKAAEKVQKDGAQGARKNDPDKKISEDEEISRGLKSVKEALHDGKKDEANRIVRVLQQRYPDNLSVQTARRTVDIAIGVSDARRNRRENEERLVGVNNEMTKSSTPSAGDVDFPEAKKWKALTEKRKQDNLTAAERSILKALETPVAIEFKGSRFEDVIEKLQTTLGVDIVMDKNTLERTSVTYDTQVSRVFRKPVQARTVLRSVLLELGLTYVIKDESIQIVTPDMAKDMMVVRAYPIGDIVAFSGPLLTPDAGKLQELETANRIIDMIKQQIDPGSWDQGTGAKIFYEPGTRSLVVKQSALVHSMLGKSLK